MYHKTSILPNKYRQREGVNVKKFKGHKGTLLDKN